jgi:hypothetical protein
MQRAWNIPSSPVLFISVDEPCCFTPLSHMAALTRALTPKPSPLSPHPLPPLHMRREQGGSTARTPRNASAKSARASISGSGPAGGPGSGSRDLDRLQEQVKELEAQLEERDERIAKVRGGGGGGFTARVWRMWKRARRR